jgi:hypothetical protein
MNNNNFDERKNMTGLKIVLGMMNVYGVVGVVNRY